MNYWNILINYGCCYFLSIDEINHYMKQYISIYNNNISYFYKYFNFNNYLFISSLLVRSITNYYSVDIFCKMSKVMTLCSLKLKVNYFK